MLESLAWTLQVLGLLIAGLALLVGLASGQIRVELAMLGVGAGLFLFARWLERRGRG